MRGRRAAPGTMNVTSGGARYVSTKCEISINLEWRLWKESVALLCSLNSTFERMYFQKYH